MERYIVEVYEGRTVWRNGQEQFHRLDGPAVECTDCTKFWYVNGKKYTEEEFLQYTKPAKEMTMEELIKELGYKVKIVEKK